jgi:hypothetical protein
MTTSDVDRLYAGLAEVASEVRGYRRELNGKLNDANERITELEKANAKREGQDIGKGTIGKWVLGVAAVSASIGSVFGVIMAVSQ